ncbi:succinylglutamate desuccinylase/aspartoacylase family protein [Rubinisphaera margarita]|uniref:succinylglutamate desuccinylase/aspartoacylase family protein n=1 Tax=Rubinisphaera margarita TaxID=2909586 RepID=UPI001EE8610A|nr:succinylglutamate desuccinylase/aspartoacylase family protein [Rubinisphaera margarita]MCG6154254.1 succinylglutamate desuccinylase/aspartoacylase family protein [Rubinisphaera margarita]
MPDRKYRLKKRSPHRWGDVRVEPGQSVEVSLVVAESYSSLSIPIPVIVQRGLEDGPTVFVTAALHGDEINGTGAIRELISHRRLNLLRGTVIFVPVVNILGFDRHSRYLPDRRDLNRCFPGSIEGSLAGRMARLIYEEIIGRSDYGIDLHTAAVRRTNFPNVRADMTNPEVARLAKAFGCEIILSGTGPDGSFRRTATEAGCPTVILEAGEVWKVEPGVVEYAVNGIHSVLSELRMVEGHRAEPPFQVTIQRTKWIRASRGGFLHFHVRPGDLVRRGTPLATNSSLTGVENNVLISPAKAIVLGMTTLPAIAPGDPICHLGLIPKRYRELERIQASLTQDDLHGRVLEHLSTNIRVTDRLEPESDDSEGIAQEETTE